MKVQVRFATVMATVALVATLCGIGGAYAGSVFITGKQIRNGSLTTQDYKKGSVQPSDVKNGSVGTTDLQNGGIAGADIGSDQVEAGDLNLPDPQQVTETGTASAEVGDAFTLLDPVETYVKVDPTSQLEITWTGSAATQFLPCQFQIRVDGLPAPGEAGTIYVPNGTVDGNISTTASFPGLPVGPHVIAVYARSVGGGGGQFPCTVGPTQAQISQTFLTAEQVI